MRLTRLCKAAGAGAAMVVAPMLLAPYSSGADVQRANAVTGMARLIYGRSWK